MLCVFQLPISMLIGMLCLRGQGQIQYYNKLVICRRCMEVHIGGIFNASNFHSQCFVNLKLDIE